MTKAERREVGLQLAKMAFGTAVIFAGCAIGFSQVCAQCKDNTCNIDTALYFAAQTVTTVGYGADIHFTTDALKRTATIASLFGAVAFSLMLSIVATLVNDAAIRRAKKRSRQQAPAPVVVALRAQ